MKKKTPSGGSSNGITITFDQLLQAVSSINDEPTPFQIARRQPAPMAFSLQMLEIASAVTEKIKIFNEMVGELRQRHFQGEKPTATAQAAFDKDWADLLAQEVTLPGRKYPRAVFSEARISPDALEHVLWLFEDPGA